ncbi:MAG: bifunctional hydroxymethylpyrimidine kinase/phosphomethylpyrimidine kinase [Epsilonproteobacteria bacterium]|nr:bifunctional hydroxymethylpyrimidine kinase/phosphomethylpyrimidine kinase [Campylobacterota bacterium]
MQNNYTPTVLTIAGSDNYGGAGVQIDLKTVHALDGYAFSTITALTAQNSIGVKAIFATPKEIFQQQLSSILDDIKVDAIKIGMLANGEIINSVIENIDRYNLKNIVLDTVLVSSSGKNLLEPSAIELMIRELFPRVDLITPNLLEVERIIGKRENIEEMAKAFFELDTKNILIKGGHSLEVEATDYLCQNGLDTISFSSPRIKTTHTHGTGCMLSSAIATHLARGESLETSVKLSKNFLYQNMKSSYFLKLRYKKTLSGRREPILLTQY